MSCGWNWLKTKNMVNWSPYVNTDSENSLEIDAESHNLYFSLT